MVCGEVELSPIGDQAEVPYRHGVVGDEPPQEPHDPKTGMALLRAGPLRALCVLFSCSKSQIDFFPFISGEGTPPLFS